MSPPNIEQGKAGINIQNITEHLSETKDIIVSSSASPTSPQSQWSQVSTIQGHSPSASPICDNIGNKKPSCFGSWWSSRVGHLHRRLRGTWKCASARGLILLFTEKAKKEPTVQAAITCDDDRVVRKLHKMPKGYPKLATYLDSDENFMMYRRFGYLQSRVILEKQDDLRKLEIDLDVMEKGEHKKRLRVANAEGVLEKDIPNLPRTENSPAKQKLLTDIVTAWKSYCEVLQIAAAMTGLNKPTNTEYRSVRHWMKNIDPIVMEEARFLQCKEDLITLRPGREHAWLDSTVETILGNCRRPTVQRLFQDSDTREKNDGSDNTMLYTRSRIENAVVSIITIMILVLLVVPVYVLYRLSSSGAHGTSLECICVLLIATLLFSTCMTVVTRAKRHEILAASAGYCALLVVFIGNIGNHIPDVH